MTRDVTLEVGFGRLRARQSDLLHDIQKLPAPPSPTLVLEWGACDPVPIRRGAMTFCPLYATIGNAPLGHDVRVELWEQFGDLCVLQGLAPYNVTISGNRQPGRFLLTTAILVHGTCPRTAAASGANTVLLNIHASVNDNSGGLRLEDDKILRVPEEVDQ
jgi:hypothetical protein